MKQDIVTKAYTHYGNIVEIKTVDGSMRIIFNQDKTFRVITDLKSKQVKDVEGPFKDFTYVTEVEQFGHPFED